MNKINFTIKDIVSIAFFAIILFVQKQLLSLLPNIQLTMFFVVLFSKKFGLIKSEYIVLIYVILDCVLMGGLGLLYFPFMLLGWGMVPLLINTIFIKINSHLLLSFLGVLFSFFYCWMLIIPTCLAFQMNVFTYFLQDILWELIFAFCSFISILFLYKPCYLVLNKIIKT